MTYFEAFTCAKDPQRPETNEDQLVLRPGVVLAVLDGATDISGQVYDDELGRGATGGRLASRAAALALQSWIGEAAETPPDPVAVVREMTEAIGALYKRLGRHAIAAEAGEHRFRSTFAGAFYWQGGIRLMRVGDCGLRVNGTPVMQMEFPGDVVLSAARAAAWRRLSARGTDPATIRSATRQLIVRGINDKAVTGEQQFTEEDLAGITETVVTSKKVLAALGGDAVAARQVLAGGLQAIRADPGAFGAQVLDGITALRTEIAVTDFKHHEVETLEVLSDGYPAMPSNVGVSAWEAALKEADTLDPDRIGAFPSTKGCDAGRFGDDRTIIFTRTGRGT